MKYFRVSMKGSGEEYTGTIFLKSDIYDPF